MNTYGKRKIQAYRRENGRVGVRNHVIILPLDDISNAACEAVANNIKGTMALPHAYGRLQFGEDLELFFRTIIGTGANPNVAAVVVIGIEPEWTKVIVDGIAKTGKPVAGFSIEQRGDLDTIAVASRKAKEFVQWASELQRVECDLSELWISTKCGESDTTTGLGSCPTVGNMYDKLIRRRHLRRLRRDLRNHRRRAHLQGPRGDARGRRKVHEDLPGLSGRGHRAFQDIRPFRQPADQGQHPRRAHHHRGEGAGQPREDRPYVEIHRRHGTCRGPDKRTGPLLHGHLLCGRRVRDPDGRRRLCHPYLPDRPGQHHRQSRSFRWSRSAPIRAPCAPCPSISTST